MKRLKKFLAVFFFTVAVSAFVLAFSVSAEEVTCSLDGVDLYFDTETGAVTDAKDTSSLTYDLEIPEEINGVKVTSIAKNAFSDLSFKRVTIPGTVESIGDYAFFNARIEELVLCYGVKTIGSSAFDVSFGSTVLKSVSFPNSLTYIGVGAFEGNRGLTSLNIPGSVTVIDDSAFAECDGIKTLILEEGVQNIGIGSFCVLGISELTIPKSVIQIGAHAFEMCEYLENVTCYSTTTIDKTAFDFCPIENMNVIEVEENLDPVLSVDGLNITVTNLGAVRDFLIAPGHHDVYAAIKQNYVLRVTEAKFGGKESYTATVTAPGEYTVLVRYTDGREQTYHYVIAEAVTPEFSVSGLSVSVSNLEGLRTIRTAPGEWKTPGEVKRAEGARNIPARNIGNDPYKLQYAEDGVYTVSLEYLNGLVVVEHFELSRTIPYVSQKGNKITLGDLDDLYVVRYAPGIYETMGEIKRAEGSKNNRPTAID
ncbi:MAG: leucine-rich repeat domain-containing protein, partial [Clostridia bacterium]|nr:leucine-rich repeat domain-containing protein [Clostridia bacterium]